MLNGNFKLAVDSIRQAKFRSLLTMFGVIVGVASVVTTVSFGEGFKNQVIKQVNHFGENIITVRPGNLVNRDEGGRITSINYLSNLTASSLSDNDYDSIAKTSGIASAIPLNLVSSTAETNEGKQYSQAFIVGTTADAPTTLNQKIAYGNFFSAEDDDKNVAVIGVRVAEELFQERAPVGKKIRIRGQEFQVRGVFDSFDTNPIITGGDYNSVIFIPYKISKQISDNRTQIFQVLVTPNSAGEVDSVVASINRQLQANHAGQTDFTILKRDENLSAISYTINIVTRFIAAVAALSLIVGGIGIMNIMLFSVSERTWEIGIRKSVGATNRQIRNQFLIESSLLSLCGGLIGILLSLAANGAMRVLTELEPVVTWPAIGITLAVSWAVGVLFGTFPAVKAARLDPIEALRRG